MTTKKIVRCPVCQMHIKVVDGAAVLLTPGPALDVHTFYGTECEASRTKLTTWMQRGIAL